MNDEKLTQMPRVDERRPFENARWNQFANVWNGHRAADMTLVDADGAPLIVSDPTGKTVGLGGGVMTAGGGGIQLSGTQRHIGDAIVTPDGIDADTDDYAPDGLATARVLRLSTDASRELSGIAAQPAGTVISIYNVGTNDLVLKNDDAASVEANRILLPGATDLTLGPDDAIQLIYDDISERWRRFG